MECAVWSEELNGKIPMATFSLTSQLCPAQGRKCCTWQMKVTMNGKIPMVTFSLTSQLCPAQGLKGLYPLDGTVVRFGSWTLHECLDPMVVWGHLLKIQI